MAGLPPKTIRFYESSGLLPVTARSQKGYRLFTPTDVRRLKLIRRTKMLGLSLPDIKELADLAFQQSCASFEDRLEVLVDERLTDVDRAIEELASLRAELLQIRVTLKDGEHREGNCAAEDCKHCRFIDD
jgi:MerR family copper efflux transcriptional regulator